MSARVSGRLPCFAVLLAAPTAFAGTYDCMIEPTQTIEVRSEVSGVIDKISVRRGDRVARGQVIVTLESSVERAAAEAARYRAQMEGPEAVAQTKLAYAKRTFARRRDMAAERLMSGQERDDAEGEMRSAEAELALARENRELAALEAEQQASQLKRRTLRSPFNGVVADQFLYPGEVVEPSDPKKPILKLAQLDPLRVHVILPREAFGSVKAGMRGQITPELTNTKKLEGTVTLVDSLIDAPSGTFAVFLEVPNPKLEIPAGIRCKATLPGGSSAK